MKTTAKKILIIVLMIVTTAIIALANVSCERARAVSVNAAYDHLGYQAFSIGYQMYTEFPMGLF